MSSNSKSSSSKPRLLCLHGACSNDEITQFQTAGLALDQRFDCVYLHGPHIVAKSAIGLDQLSDGPFYAWSDPTKSLYEQEEMWERSLDYIADYCRKSDDNHNANNNHRGCTFDGIFGFSQGAAIITNFCHPNIWKTKYNMKDCPWKFAILACGAGGHRITGVSRDSITKIDMPSFHIYGKNDRQLNDSKIISDYWSNTQLCTHTHSRGHEIDIQMHTREKEMMKKLNSFYDELKNNNKKKGGSWLQKLDMSMPEFYLCGKTFGG